MSVNTKLHVAEAGLDGGTSTRDSGLNGSISFKRTDSNITVIPASHPPDQQNGPPPPAPAALPAEAKGSPPGQTRRIFFRAFRLALSGGLMWSVVFYTRDVVDQARSEQAYINGEITGLRAPISGQLHLETASGRLLRAGDNVFSIENTRFGNQEVSSQLNWVTESAERLEAESDEAALRFKQQEEIYRVHQKLFDEQVLSRLVLLEEQTKLEVARAAMTNKQTLAAQAKERWRNTQRQVELQRAATVKMPFDGVAWAVPAKNGAEVSTHETILEVLDPKRIWVDAFFAEKHLQKIEVGTAVQVRTLDGAFRCDGVVELVRAGVGRIPYEGQAAVNLGESPRRRVAVRIRLDAGHAFTSSEFFGVGRNVFVTLARHD